MIVKQVYYKKYSIKNEQTLPQYKKNVYLCQQMRKKDFAGKPNYPALKNIVHIVFRSVFLLLFVL
jgi:hypothetical protein